MQSEEHKKGIELMNERKYQEAIEVFLACHEKEKKPAFYSNISLCYYKLGDYQKGMEYARKCIIEYPDFERAYVRLQHNSEKAKNYSSFLLSLIKQNITNEQHKVWEGYYESSKIEMKIN